MKIGIITHFFPKTTETFITDRITGLIDRGVEVHIFARKNPASTIPVENTSVEKITSPKYKKYSLENITTYIPEYKTDLLNKELIRNNIDIAHFQWGYCAELFLQDANLCCPFITNFHEVDTPSNWNLSKKIQHYEKVKMYSTKSLPISDYLKVKLLQLGFEHNSLQTHHTGTDLNIFKPSDKKKKSNIFTITTNGSLIEKKGHHLTILALKDIKKQIGNFKLNIVGSGVLYTEYVRLIKSVGLESNVIFHNNITPIQVRNLLQDSDLFVLPSITGKDGSEEGIPVALMEAGAVRLPIISSYHSGIPELISHGNEGLLIKEGDVKKLQEYILLLKKNEAYSKYLATNLYRKITKVYNLHKLISEQLEIYKSI